MNSRIDPAAPVTSWWARLGSVLDGSARAAVLRHLAGLGTAITVIEGDRGVTLGNGEPRITIQVHDPRFWGAIATGGTIAAGETYADGWWSCDRLAELVTLLARDMARIEAMDTGWRALGVRIARRLWHLARPNTRSGARRNIAAHYDLSNDLYKTFLDGTMMYSSAIYPRPGATLEEAQAHRLDLICRRLRLGPDDHLVEIGSGWGGMAIHAARTTGCRVTTTTISHQQFTEATARVAAAGLADRVTVLERDYRDLPAVLGEGSATKIVSLEMIEAIGSAQFPTFFATCRRLLRADGMALVQAITVPDRRFAAAAREVDFIKRHIFPGCCIPSTERLLVAAKGASDLDLIDLHDITPHYATTLRDWRERFLAAVDRVKALGFDDRFVRLWEFYLAYCEGGFRSRAISDVQYLFARPAAAVAEVRA
jgi:cyclopropane-fatty-acyl-phospholipid synthase